MTGWIKAMTEGGMTRIKMDAICGKLRAAANYSFTPRIIHFSKL